MEPVEREDRSFLSFPFLLSTYLEKRFRIRDPVDPFIYFLDFAPSADFQMREREKERETRPVGALS